MFIMTAPPPLPFPHVFFFFFVRADVDPGAPGHRPWSGGGEPAGQEPPAAPGRGGLPVQHGRGAHEGEQHGGGRR